MSYWENTGETDEWYTPKYIFEAMGNPVFDMDVASPKDTSKTFVNAIEYIFEDSLNKKWNGFCWCNPPFGGRNSKALWLDKMSTHGNGIVLVPDRTSTDWWQEASLKSVAYLNVRGKIKFVKPDGSTGDSPSTGTTLFAYGSFAYDALFKASWSGLGVLQMSINIEK